MVKLYSNSKLWLYENCPEFYKIKYLDKKLPKIPVSINAFLGQAVHESLEWLYKEHMNEKSFDLDDLIMYFVKFWRENFSLEFRINENEDFESFLNKGIKFLVNYYEKNKPFLDKTIHLEKKIIFPLDNNGEYKIQGYIDRVVINKEGEYEVHDYKTNDSLKTQKEIDQDRQLAFYHLGLQELFGTNIKVKLVWHFLAHSQTVFSSRTQEELDLLKINTLELIKKIESNLEWKACNKRWCDWCEFKKRNNLNLN